LKTPSFTEELSTFARQVHLVETAHLGFSFALLGLAGLRPKAGHAHTAGQQGHGN